jgi:hypothetical protein
MKIRLIDGSVHEADRAEVTNGRLEIDIQGKTAEEIQDIFSVPALLTNIELLMDDGEKFGDVPGWTTYSGVMVLGDTKTVILTQSANITEQRLTAVESEALKAKMLAEDLKENGIPFEKNAVLNASVMVARASAQVLGDVEALKVKAIYSTWEELVFDGYVAMESGYKFIHNGELYKIVNAGQRFQAEWIPGQGTESIFTRIDEVHVGSLEDPIPAAANMEYTKGLYYIEDGQVYQMNREGMEDGEKVVLQFLPSELAGQYFKLVS